MQRKFKIDPKKLDLISSLLPEYKMELWFKKAHYKIDRGISNMMTSEGKSSHPSFIRTRSDD